MSERTCPNCKAELKLTSRQNEGGDKVRKCVACGFTVVRNDQIVADVGQRKFMPGLEQK